VLNGLASDLAAGAQGTSTLPALCVLAFSLGGAGFAWPRDFPPAKFPVSLVSRNEAGIRGRRVFTSDQWGDYLIYRFYPAQTVFLDGRSDFYGPDTGRLYLRLIYGHPDWRDAFDRFGIRAVLAERTWPLASLLRQSDRWRIVDEQGPAVLFERRPPQALILPAKENAPSRRTMPQERRRDDLAQETSAARTASGQVEGRRTRNVAARVF
jgi:hypothetical protein